MEKKSLLFPFFGYRLIDELMYRKVKYILDLLSLSLSLFLSLSLSIYIYMMSWRS